MRSDRTSGHYTGGFEHSRDVRQHEAIIEYHLERALLDKFSAPVSEQCDNSLGSDIDVPSVDFARLYDNNSSGVVLLHCGGHPSATVASSPNASAVGCAHLDSQRLHGKRTIHLPYDEFVCARMGHFAAPDAPSLWGEQSGHQSIA